MTLARQAVEAASEKQASDVVLLDLRGLTTVADFFVICSGETERQIHAIAEAVLASVRGAGGSLLRQEGTEESGWVLLDCGEVVVHLFAPGERRYYRLEKVWEKAVPLLRIQ